MLNAILKNSRQMPKQEEVCSQTNYCDKIYAYLQVNSHLQDGIRIVPKALAKYTTIHENLNISRQTVSTKMKYLVEMGFIIPPAPGQDYYIIQELEKTDAFLIPYQTLSIMLSALSENSINLYIYLFKLFIAHNYKQCSFTIAACKAFCGFGTKSTSNNYIITDILKVLKTLGLIDYYVANVPGEKGGIKTTYFLTDVKQEIKVEEEVILEVKNITASQKQK